MRAGTLRSVVGGVLLKSEMFGYLGPNQSFSTAALADTQQRSASEL